jgi:hypothetical protein
MSEGPQEFHDPELKAAIIRLRGGHRIRPDLRETVLRRLEEQRAQIARDENGEPVAGSAGADGGPVASADPALSADDVSTSIDAGDQADVATQAPPAAQPAPTMRLAGDAKDFPPAAQKPDRATRGGGGGFRMPHWIAAAAVLLVVVGLSAAYWRHVKHEEEEREEYLADNRTLLEQMIAAQEQPATPNAVAANLSDPAAVAAEIQGKLSRTVPVVKLTGWKLDAAGVTQVAGVQAAQWRMSKGKRTLTVLSLPRDAFKGEEGYDEYDFVLDNHAIAGYVKDGGIHCVVGDPSMTASESIALREELRRG